MEQDGVKVGGVTEPRRVKTRQFQHFFSGVKSRSRALKLGGDFEENTDYFWIFLRDPGGKCWARNAESKLAASQKPSRAAPPLPPPTRRIFVISVRVCYRWELVTKQCCQTRTHGHLPFFLFLIQLFAQLVPLFLAAHTQSIFNDDQHHLAAVQKLWGNLSISDGIFPGWKCLRLDSKRFVTNRETCSEILFDEIEMLTIYGAAGESNQLAGAQNLSLLLLLLRLLLHGVSENNDRFFGNWGLKLLK